MKSKRENRSDGEIQLSTLRRSIRKVNHVRVRTLGYRERCHTRRRRDYRLGNTKCASNKSWKRARQLDDVGIARMTREVTRK